MARAPRSQLDLSRALRVAGFTPCSKSRGHHAIWAAPLPNPGQRVVLRDTSGRDADWAQIRDVRKAIDQYGIGGTEGPPKQSRINVTYEDFVEGINDIGPLEGFAKVDPIEEETTTVDAPTAQWSYSCQAALDYRKSELWEDMVTGRSPELWDPNLSDARIYAQAHWPPARAFTVFRRSALDAARGADVYYGKRASKNNFLARDWTLLGRWVFTKKSPGETKTAKSQKQDSQPSVAYSNWIEAVLGLPIQVEVDAMKSDPDIRYALISRPGQQPVFPVATWVATVPALIGTNNGKKPSLCRATRSPDGLWELVRANWSLTSTKGENAYRLSSWLPLPKIAPIDRLPTESSKETGGSALRLESEVFLALLRDGPLDTHAILAKLPGDRKHGGVYSRMNRLWKAGSVTRLEVNGVNVYALPGSTRPMTQTTSTWPIADDPDHLDYWDRVEQESAAEDPNKHEIFSDDAIALLHSLSVGSRETMGEGEELPMWAKLAEGALEMVAAGHALHAEADRLLEDQRQATADRVQTKAVENVVAADKAPIEMVEVRGPGPAIPVVAAEISAFRESMDTALIRAILGRVPTDADARITLIRAGIEALKGKEEQSG